MRFDDAISGSFLVVLGVLLIALSSQFEPLRHIQYGPGFFPTLIGIGFVGCGSGLVVRRVMQKRPWRLAEFDQWVGSSRIFIGFLLVPVSVLGYIFLSEPLGFIPTMFLLLVAQLAWFSRRWTYSVVLAVAATVCLQVFFQGIMGVPLPWGVLEPVSGSLKWP